MIKLIFSEKKTIRNSNLICFSFCRWVASRYFFKGGWFMLEIFFPRLIWGQELLINLINGMIMI